MTSTGRFRGESEAPVGRARTGRGPAVEPLIEVAVPPLLPDWRKLVCASALKGLPREVAAGSEVVELDERRVLLRPLTQTLVTPEIRATLSAALTHAAGRPFEVAFTPEERGKDAVTLSLVEESERRAARLALIDAFKSDPFVQKCLEVFNATVDETSVVEIDTKTEDQK